MNSIRQRPFNNYWLTLILIMLFLLVPGYLTIQQSFERDMSNSVLLIQQELNLLAHLSTRLLQAGEYDAIQPLLQQWSQNYPNTQSIRLTSHKGFEIGEYLNPTPAIHIHMENQNLTYGYRGNATLSLTKNVGWIYNSFHQLIGYAFGIWLFLWLIGVYIIYNLNLHQRENKRLEELGEQLIQSNATLKKERSLLRYLIDSIPDLIFFKDKESVYMGCNKAFEKYANYSEQEQIGKTDFDLFDKETATYRRSNDQTMMQAGTPRRNEEWVTYPDGRKVLLDTLKTPYYDPHGNVLGMIGISRDITEIKHFQDQLEFMAYHDPLTDLPNRRYLMEKLQDAIYHAERQNNLLAICTLDLDGFKHINDQFGHNTGDKVLIEFAQRLNNAVRLIDTVARWGGDEFTMLFTEIQHPSECIEFLERILNLVQTPIQIDNNTFELSASIGLTTFPDDNNDADTLLRHADQAMFEAKLTGKNHYEFFDHQQNQLIHQHHQTRSRIEQAIQENELILYYQPQIHLNSGKAYGVEALVRWNHPDKGLLAPGKFLPFIEGHALNVQLDWWVFEQAFSQLEQWLDNDINLHLSINVASITFQQPDFVTKLHELFNLYPRINPRLISLELLETAALGNLDTVATKMHECQQLGIAFSLDDFGTGYSSLTYLSKLPADMLKIDQSFVRDMLIDEGDASIVEGIIKLAVSFNRMVIAEGVEELMQGSKLLEMGCSYAQGYAIAKPMPTDNLLAWLDHFEVPKEWAVINSKDISINTSGHNNVIPLKK